MTEDCAETWCRQVLGGVPLEAGCVDGHFPGEPVVPGAVLLGYAAELLDEHGFALVTVRRMKFLRTLSPGRTFTIDVKPKMSGTEIAWRENGTVIARASVAICAHDQ